MRAPSQIKAGDIDLIKTDITTLDQQITKLENDRVATLCLYGYLFGFGIVRIFHIDALQFMRVFLDASAVGALNVCPKCLSWTKMTAGELITGLGAEMGAASWQDIVDTLTKTKLSVYSATEQNNNKKLNKIEGVLTNAKNVVML